jgi:DNA (cytosine-5)-methyltransferase 1
MNLAALDLFCGAGGLSAGLTKAGFEIMGAFDSWERAVETYRLNYSHPVRCSDLAKIRAPEIWTELGIEPRSLDLMVGGPPCQGFSIQRIGQDYDHRNNLVLEFARLVSELRPRMFLMENVPGLLGKRGRQLIAAFEHALTSAGYRFEAALLNAADYGVPQVRKRELPPFRFPEPTQRPEDYRTVWEAIGDLPLLPEHRAPFPGDPLHRRTRLSPMNIKRLQHIPPGGGMEDLPVELRVDCHKNGADRIGHRYVYGRLAPHKPAATITARFDSFTRGKFAHPYEDRNITLREGARLQTFDDGFHFVGTQEEIAAQIGNAVPPMLAEVLGQAIESHLSKPTPRKVGPQVWIRRSNVSGALQMTLFSSPGEK